MKKITLVRPVSVLPKDLSLFINKFGYFSYSRVHVLLHLLVNQSLQISKSLFFHAIPLNSVWTTPWSFKDWSGSHTVP